VPSILSRYKYQLKKQTLLVQWSTANSDVHLLILKSIMISSSVPFSFLLSYYVLISCSSLLPHLARSSSLQSMVVLQISGPNSQLKPSLQPAMRTKMTLSHMRLYFDVLILSIQPRTALVHKWSAHSCVGALKKVYSWSWWDSETSKVTISLVMASL